MTNVHCSLPPSAVEGLKVAALADELHLGRCMWVWRGEGGWRMRRWWVGAASGVPPRPQIEGGAGGGGGDRKTSHGNFGGGCGCLEIWQLDFGSSIMTDLLQGAVAPCPGRLTPLQLPVQGVIHATTAVSLSFMQKFEVGRPLCYLSWLDEVDLTYFNIFFVEEGPS